MRLVEPDYIVPAIHDRQIVWLLGITAKMDGDAAVLVFFPGDIVDRVSIGRVLLKVTLGVIEAVQKDDPLQKRAHQTKQILKEAFFERACPPAHRVDPVGVVEIGLLQGA